MNNYIRKIIIFIMILVFCFSITAFASQVTVYVNNEKVEFDVNPFIENGRTLVPLRGVFEKLGAKVDWNKNILEVVIKDEYNEIEMILGKDKVLVNGQIKDIDVPTKMVNSRTFAPLRFIIENLGHNVKWDGNTQTVYITKNNTVPVSNNTLPVIGSKENLITLLEYSSKLHGYLGFREGIAVNDTVVTDKASESSAPSAESNSGIRDSSDTNNQVEGVDEGDIIKNNGKHIFLNSNNSIKIIDSNPQNPKIISKVIVPENTYISEIFVTGNKLVVIGQNNYFYFLNDKIMNVEYIMPPRLSQNRCNVLIYNIENIEKPVLEREYLIDGNYISGRTIDNNLYFITTMYLNMGYDYYNKGEYDIPLPSYTDVLKNEKNEINYDRIKYFPNYIDARYMLTVGINLEDIQSKPDVDVYLGGSDSIYVSKNSLYTAVTDYSYDSNIQQKELYNPGYTVNTVIYKFTLSNGTIDYKSNGKVPGNIINQFSMDEHNDNLRIATTTGEVWQNNSENNIYILDTNLKILGRLEGLAKGERIYSTRFMGNKVYMVTFRQVDPLFVIDTSNPSKPKVLGELKIPGYSTYLHMVDEDHVLGFGYETKENQWGGVETQGLKLSLFDVSNVSRPKEIDNEIIGKAGSYSELLYNHKSLMFSLSKGLMAFPVYRTTDNYKNDFVGAYVYNVTPESLKLKTTISHMENLNDNKYYYGNEIRRVIYIGDYLYTFSDNMMQVHSISDNSKVNELNLLK